MSYTLDSAALAVVLLSAAISLFAWKDASRLNQDTLYITTVNTRINTCTTLSNYHKDLGSGTVVTADKQKPVSSPAERSEKEANLARELTLCLVGYVSIDQVRQCVNAVNANDIYKVHDNMDSNSSSPVKGADVLAC